MANENAGGGKAKKKVIAVPSRPVPNPPRRARACQHHQGCGVRHHRGVLARRSGRPPATRRGGGTRSGAARCLRARAGGVVHGPAARWCALGGMGGARCDVAVRRARPADVRASCTGGRGACCIGEQPAVPHLDLRPLVTYLLTYILSLAGRIHQPSDLRFKESECSNVQYLHSAYASQHTLQCRRGSWVGTAAYAYRK
jgi:hypothetical protein